MATSQVTRSTPKATGARLLVVSAAVAVGGIIRLYFVLAERFPLNDGGLFYLMTQELQQNGYALPAFTAYNGAAIPYAYPPLGLYLAGLLADIGHWPLIEVFRFLPLALNLATIAAFCRLSWSLLPDSEARPLAAFIFVLLPGSFAWQIMGGGVTRSPGFLFATLALGQACHLYMRPQKRHVLLTALWAAGAVLSHPAMALTTALGMALLCLAYGRSRAGLARTGAVAVGTAAITAPWWGAVVARHGLAPFLAAGQSPEPTAAGALLLLTLQITDEVHFPLLAGLALLGVARCLGQRRFLLPAWVVVVFLADPRTAATTATVPVSLLAGLGIVEVLLPALQRGSALPPATESAVAAAVPAAWHWARDRLAQGVIVFIFVFALSATMLGGMQILTALPAAEREAMQWVALNTPESSAFLVVTGDRMWGGDRSSEWFPVLAGRRSVATVQGTEWLAGFQGRALDYTAAQRCARQSAACLDGWVLETGVSFTHVYVAKRAAVPQTLGSGDCCSGLRASMGEDPTYRMVYDGPGATVYARVAG